MRTRSRLGRLRLLPCVPLLVLALGILPREAVANPENPSSGAISEQYQSAAGVVVTDSGAPVPEVTGVETEAQPQPVAEPPSALPETPPGETAGPATDASGGDDGQYHMTPVQYHNDGTSENDVTSLDGHNNEPAPPSPPVPGDLPGVPEAPGVATPEQPVGADQAPWPDPPPAVDVPPPTEATPPGSSDPTVTEPAPPADPPPSQPGSLPEPPAAGAGNVVVVVRIDSPGDEGPVVQVNGGAADPPIASVADNGGRLPSLAPVPVVPAPNAGSLPWNWTWYWVPGCTVPQGAPDPVASGTGASVWNWTWIWGCATGKPAERGEGPAPTSAPAVAAPAPHATALPAAAPAAAGRGPASLGLRRAAGRVTRPVRAELSPWSYRRVSPPLTPRDLSGRRASAPGDDDGRATVLGSLRQLPPPPLGLLTRPAGAATGGGSGASPLEISVAAVLAMLALIPPPAFRRRRAEPPRRCVRHSPSPPERPG